MKIIWEYNNLTYITNGAVVRVLNLETGDAHDTTDKQLIETVINNGKNLIPTQEESL